MEFFSFVFFFLASYLPFRLCAGILLEDNFSLSATKSYFFFLFLVSSIQKNIQCVAKRGNLLC